MNRIAWTLLALFTGGLSALVVAPQAGGQTCYSAPVVKHHVNYGAHYGYGHAKVVKHYDYQNVFLIPVAAYFPAQYATIVQQPAEAKATEQAGELRQVLEAIKGIDGRLKALESGRANPFAPQPLQAPPPQPKAQGQAPAAGQQPSALAVVTAKCAMCHDGRNAADKGGGFEMVRAGQLLPLTRDKAERTIELIYGKKMPKPSSGLTLTPLEKLVLADHYTP